MKSYPDSGDEILISRRATLLDANVLIAAFCPAEKLRHSDSWMFLENPEFSETEQWLVPVVAIVEAWGMLARKNRENALRMLAWLHDPGNPVAVCRYSTGHMESDRLQTTGTIVEKYKVDVVDAILVAVADRVSAECVLQPHLQVATYDLNDFPRLKRVLGARVSIYDMNSLQLLA